MNKCQFRLFFIVILSFIALDQKCSDDTKYFKELPTESKIREFCLKFPKKYYPRSIAWIIGDLVNRKKHCNFKVTQSEQLAYKFAMKNEFGILHNNNEDGLAYAICEIGKVLEFSLDQTLQETTGAMEMYSQLKEDVEKAKKEKTERLIKRNNGMDKTLQETAEAMEIYSELKKNVEKVKKEKTEKLIKRNNEIKKMKDTTSSLKKEASIPGNEFWLVNGEK